MSEFIKNIVNVRFDDLGASLYFNELGSASIRFDRLNDELPSSSWLKFDSLESAEEFIESKRGDSDLHTLVLILESAFLV